ncbi:MAG: PorP/SprF family type IX secretion system membrane protein [Bacteroidales bacterium]|nr:PorP/SprF family type IX secretion system membrane protein [Bacteroidales bacterium]
MLAICASIIFTFQISTFNPVTAQDQHFSMLDLDPLLFNPAYSGFFDGTARFGIVYRNQWASVSAPFQTLSATAEVGLLRDRRSMSGLSAGLWLTADREGTLDYGTTAASAIVSWFKGLGNGNNIVSLAAEAGIGQTGFSEDEIVMGDGTETFARTRATYPTLGAGVAWYCQLSDVLYTKLGISVRNINEPDISYTGLSDDARLSRRYNIYGRAEWRMTSSWGVLPVVGYQRQEGFNELVYGCDVRWYVREKPRDYLAFGAGLMGRHGDAAALNLAVLWREWTFGFSYDANLSKLAAASHTLGAFEVGVVYMISKKDKRVQSLPCPIF